MAARLIEVPPGLKEHGETVLSTGGDGGLSIKIKHVPVVAYQLGCGDGMVPRQGFVHDAIQFSGVGLRRGK